MSTVQPTTTRPTPAAWLAVTLAFLTAVIYVLIGQGLLPIGDVPQSDGGAIVYVAAGCYLVGGLLVLARRRWLWTIGLLINSLVVLFFILMYQGRPLVLFSPGGVVSKAAQLLLELVLIYLIIGYGRGGRVPAAR